VSIARDKAPERRQRIARARSLADRHPAVGDPLTFYAGVLEVQQQVADQWPSLRPGPSLSTALPGLIAGLTGIARPALVSELAQLPLDDRWPALLDGYWQSGGRVTNDVSELSLFVMDTLIAPFAERSAQADAGAHVDDDRPYECPWCSAPPNLAVLREEGHGARRSLLCGWCLREWATPRLVCIACGESRFDALPVFSAEEFEAVRVDVCETCHVYLKTIDLTRDGGAVPLVDDLATLPLDLWARERGYRRLRPNALRI
jgi:formate dehydrogenase maturation protein FdhE